VRVLSYGAVGNPMGTGAFVALNAGTGASLGAIGIQGQPTDIALGPVTAGMTASRAVSPSRATLR
jgi:hypothetical protein